MPTWYETTPYSLEIRTVEVTKSTDKMITINGRSRAKASDYWNYFPTWDEARDSLIARAELAIESAKEEIEAREKDLATLNKMRPPKQPA